MAPEHTPPSGEEVRRRLSSLYDQAENATGNFNATRALANSSRKPARRAVGQGRAEVDPAQEALMRQWFDGARSRFGPSAPAVLPSDRQPDRGREGARPAEGARPPKELPAELPTVYQLEQTARPVAELTAAPVRELTAGPASELTARPVLELTAGPAAEMTAARAPAAPGPEAAVRAALPAASAPAATSQKSSLHLKKHSARRKLAAAQELLSRHVARQSVPVAQAPAMEYRPVEQPGLPSFQPAPQPTAFQSAPQAASYAPTPQTATYASAPQATVYASAPEPAAFQAAPMATAFESAAQPPSFQSAPLPTSYQSAPQQPEYKSVLLPLAYESAPQQPEFTSMLLPLAYESAPLPSAYEPAPQQPEFTSVLLPLAYESAVQSASYQSAPMPPAYASAPMPPAYEPAPPPPAYEPAPPPVDDAWRQSLRPGKEQVWPTAPGPVDTNPGFSIDSLVAAAAAPPVVGYDSRASEAVAFARAQVGRPCVWGASGPGSYDPSGLTQAAWKSAGVMLPRATHDQARVGPAVAVTDVQPGDLVFFHANVSHVGLYVGDGMMVHAPSPGARIAEESINYAGQAAIHSVVRPV
jgi:cell wall-associated NlpC family hydrolase